MAISSHLIDRWKAIFRDTSDERLGLYRCNFRRQLATELAPHWPTGSVDVVALIA